MCENGDGLLQDDLFVWPFLHSHLDICQHDLCAWPRSVCLRAVEEKRLTATFIFGPRDGMQSETVKFVWCFFCWTSDKCLTRSLVVVKVYSLPMCTFRTLAVWLREQLWLVKLTENHNSILVRVMLQCCMECCIDCSLKKKKGMNSVRVPLTFSQTGIES